MVLSTVSPGVGGGVSARTLNVLVEDHPGVLNRVTSLLRRRRFNIESLTVGSSGQPGLSRMTIALHADAYGVEQAVKQLYKLIEVRKVTDLSVERFISRELALIKVSAHAESRAQIREVAELFGARVIDVTPRSMVLEAVGSEERIAGLLDTLRPYGVREIARSGRVAIARGAAGPA